MSDSDKGMGTDNEMFPNFEPGKGKEVSSSSLKKEMSKGK